MDDNYCHEWWNSRLKNPESNRVIKLNGPVYTKLKAKCGEPPSDMVHVRDKRAHKVEVSPISPICKSVPLTTESIIKWYRKHTKHFPMDWLTMHLTFNPTLLPQFMLYQIEHYKNVKQITHRIYDELMNHATYSRAVFEAVLDKVEENS